MDKELKDKIESLKSDAPVKKKKCTTCKNNKEIAKGNAYILAPIWGNHIQFTLEKFYFDKKTDKLGVKLAITNNPFETLFFIFYGFGILSMLGYLLVTWKRKL